MGPPLPTLPHHAEAGSQSESKGRGSKGVLEEAGGGFERPGPSVISVDWSGHPGSLGSWWGPLALVGMGPMPVCGAWARAGRRPEVGGSACLWKPVVTVDGQRRGCEPSRPSVQVVAANVSLMAARPFQNVEHQGVKAQGLESPPPKI